MNPQNNNGGLHRQLARAEREFCDFINNYPYPQRAVVIRMCHNACSDWINRTLAVPVCDAHALQQFEAEGMRGYWRRRYQLNRESIAAARRQRLNQGQPPT